MSPTSYCIGITNTFLAKNMQDHERILEIRFNSDFGQGKVSRAQVNENMVIEILLFTNQDDEYPC